MRPSIQYSCLASFLIKTKFDWCTCKRAHASSNRMRPSLGKGLSSASLSCLFAAPGKVKCFRKSSSSSLQSPTSPF